MEKFYLGLDIGTDSVGIACTDENYNLLRAKGKDLWAVRLFDEADTAVKRRTFRTARRRLQRRKWRIDILQELFAPYIEDLFFKRLNNSGFVFEDKDDELQSPYSLFADKTFTDKDFYKKYKTVYHLRRALIDGKEKADLRLYYLALHHIIKYRGHFLFEGSLGEVRDLSRLFKRLNDTAAMIFDENAPVFDITATNEFKNIVLDNTVKSNDKKSKLFALFDCVSDKRKKSVLTLILGKSAALSDVYDNDDYKEEKSISFDKLSDEEFEALQETLGDDYEYLETVREIYNYFMFENILSGKRYISDAMIGLYDKHKNDLHNLKVLIKDCCGTDDYKLMFKSLNEKNNYVNYIGYTKVGKKKVNAKKCLSKDFSAYVKKFLEGRKNSIESKGEKYTDLCNAILSDIAENKFMPKILNADNGLFPHQINLDELIKILESLCKYYPEFSQKDDDGLSISDKIIKLFEFRIPYYVGPLNTYHAESGGNSWAVRKEDGRILPWNIERKIDMQSSNEAFMRRMTGKCSYLHGEDVLPKCSMFYQAYDVLNQLNKLKIDEHPISAELKQQIFNELFLNHRRVTDKTIRNYLVSSGKVSKSDSDKITLSGKDGDFKANMNSYITLCGVLGEQFVRAHGDICENIILWHTLNTDRNIVERAISEHYGDIAEIRNNIKQLKGLTFKDFGRLSYKFLCELSGGTSPNGNNYTILGELYNTNNNLNELLFGEEYSFMQSISEENGDSNGEVTYETLEEMHLSPQVKRGVWQALKMVDECVRTVGKTPDKIFIEVTRGGGEKGKRTSSRQNKLSALYNEARKTENDLSALMGELNRKTDMELRQERLYLYFLQLGKCAYSGEHIELEQLNSNLYDVDHIMPRSITKDDSIDNKVLVKRELNVKKSNIFPMCEALHDEFVKMLPTWKMLNRISVNGEKLMSDKKYALLTRTKPLDENDFKDFVSRQLVVTGQSAKAVAEILKRKYGEQTAIVYSKAGNVNDFKQKYGIVKCRDTNDLHHARDAYLNIAVGNVYDTKFGSVAKRFYYKDNVWYEYATDKLFDKPLAGACWDGKSSVSHVKDVLSKHSMIVTRYAYTGKGEFYNATVYPKSAELEPRKMAQPYDNTEKYGGYKGLDTGYFAVVYSQDKKGKLKKTIEAIPVLVDALEKPHAGSIMRYLTEKLGLIEPKIVVPKLKIKSLLKINGSYFWIAGKDTDKQFTYHNAMQWYTDEITDRYVNELSKLCKLKAENKLSAEQLSASEFVLNTNRNGERKIVINSENNLKLFDMIIEQLSKPFYKGASGFSAVRKTLVDKREMFSALSVSEQAQLLSGAVRILKCDGTNADLSKLGESATSGRLRISNDITKADVTVIHLSECGFTEKRQKL